MSNNKNNDSRKDEYLDTQMSMLSRLISNTMRYFTSKEVKSIINEVENTINSTSEDDKNTPQPIKELVKNTIKFTTTKPAKRFIKFIEEKSDEDLDRAVMKVMSHNYNLVKKTYNGFLEFVVSKMSQKDDSENIDK